MVVRARLQKWGEITKVGRDGSWARLQSGARLQKWGEMVVGPSFQKWGEMFLGRVVCNSVISVQQ